MAVTSDSLPPAMVTILVGHQMGDAFPITAHETGRPFDTKTTERWYYDLTADQRLRTAVEPYLAIPVNPAQIKGGST